MPVHPIVPDPVVILTESHETLSVVVYSARLLDFPRVLAHMTAKERATLKRYHLGDGEYVPAKPDDLDRAAGFRYRDEWVFEAPPTGVEWVESGEDPSEVWAIAPADMPEGDVRGSGDPQDLGEVTDLLGSVELGSGRIGWIYRRMVDHVLAA